MFSKSENGGSRPSSITRSSRASYASELETLPSEVVECSFELNEEVLDVEDISEDESPTKFDIIMKMNESKTFGGQGGGDIGNADEDSGESPVSVENNVSPECAESKLEIKIRKGLEKVKKLDEILNEKVKEEKEAKRSRYALEKQFQSEVAELIQEKGAYKVCGSQQLIYLCATSDHRDVDEEDDIQPIFHTQIDAEYYKDKIDDSENNIDETASSASNDCASETGSKSERAKKGKDFVKRNIQLASHAQELVPLTEEEKKRLDELLADDSDLLMVENPFSAPSITNNAYQFSNDELSSLEKINDRLKELIPVEDVSLILNDDNLHELDKLDATNKFSPRGEDIVLIESKCGEQVLQEGHDERTVTCRLQDIDQKLAQLHCDEEGGSQLIDPDLLRKLLDVNSRLTSGSVSVCDSLRSKSVICSDVDSVVTGSEIQLENDMNDHQNVFME